LADYPAAMAFVEGSITTYLVCNFSDQVIDVTYSDGKKATALGLTWIDVYQTRY